jgi:hypothetical protein
MFRESDIESLLFIRHVGLYIGSTFNSLLTERTSGKENGLERVKSSSKHSHTHFLILAASLGRIERE